MSTTFATFVSLIEVAMQLNTMLLDPLAIAMFPRSDSFDDRIVPLEKGVTNVEVSSNGCTGGAPSPPDAARGKAAPEPAGGIVMFLGTNPPTGNAAVKSAF